ncbi:hypothetical protein MNB_SUP05-SYMBIONT-7-428 [hydrothermal vent metagenome]|uniref:Uncharacterized protein n=1 Tax=hydrothermal vent metagenome TaxID=652676 RepID=A0A1W1E5Y3_9ZZZZ
MTQKARIIVRFKGLKKSRIVRTFLVSLVFINGIIYTQSQQTLSQAHQAISLAQQAISQAHQTISLAKQALSYASYSFSLAKQALSHAQQTLNLAKHNYVFQKHH